MTEQPTQQQFPMTIDSIFKLKFWDKVRLFFGSQLQIRVSLVCEKDYGSVQGQGAYLINM